MSEKALRSSLECVSHTGFRLGHCDGAQPHAITSCLAPDAAAPLPESQPELITAALIVLVLPGAVSSTCVRQRSHLAVGEA